MEKLTGFIPAGGQGSRLSPLTDRVPKPLLLMGDENRHLIDLPLELLDKNCDETFVSTHYRAGSIEDYLTNRPKVHILRDNSVLGNAGSLIEHYSSISDLDPNGSVIIVPGDHVFDGLSIEEFYAAHQERDLDVTMLTVPPKPYGDYVEANDGFAERTTKERTPLSLSRTGIYIVKNNYLVSWAHQLRSDGWDGEQKNITTDLIDPAIENGKAAIFRMDIDGYWDDAGTFKRYHQNNMRLSSDTNVISREAMIESDVTLKRCVVLGAAVIKSGTALEDAIISTQNGTSFIEQIQTS